MKSIAIILSVGLAVALTTDAQARMKVATATSMKDALKSTMKQLTDTGNDSLDSFVRSSVDLATDALSSFIRSVLIEVYGEARGERVNQQLAYCMVDTLPQWGPFFLDFELDWYRHFVSCTQSDPAVRIGEMVGDINDLAIQAAQPCKDYLDPDIDLMMDVPQYFEPFIRNAVSAGYQQMADAFDLGIQIQDRLSDSATEQFARIAFSSMAVGIDPNFLWTTENSWTVVIDDINNLFNDLVTTAIQTALRDSDILLQDITTSFYSTISQPNQFNEEQVQDLFSLPGALVQSLERQVNEMLNGQAPTQADANDMSDVLTRLTSAYRLFSWFNIDWNNFLGQYIPIICQMKAEAESELRVNIRENIDPQD